MAEIVKPGVVGRGALYLQASMLVCFLAGSSAPVRLDSFDPVICGFPPTMLVIVYGTYAFAALLSLFVLGSLSDFALPVLLASSTVLGFFCSVGPAFLRHFELMALDGRSGGWTFYAPYAVPPSQALALDGLCLFAFGGSAAVALFLPFKRAGSAVTRLGMVLLLVGTGVTMLALRASSSPLLLVACVIAGAGTGVGFQTAVRGVLLLTPASQCAALSSALYLVAFSTAVLVAVLGHLQVYSRHEYLACVLVLCALALVGSFRWRTPELA